MIKDTWNNEAVEKEYKLEDYRSLSVVSKLLSKKSTFNYKGTKCVNVFLVPYSELFKYNSSSSFNSKKFSII